VIPDPNDRPVVSAEEAFKELGIDRTTGYRSIRDGTFPVEVIRVGRLIKVPTIGLLRLLRIEGQEPDASLATVASPVRDDGISGSVSPDSHAC